MQVAYQALDNMEVEEVKNISFECDLLYRGQQGLLHDLAQAQHGEKVAGMKLAWVDSGEGEEDEKRMLRHRVRAERDSMERLRIELQEPRMPYHCPTVPCCRCQSCATYPL